MNTAKRYGIDGKHLRAKPEVEKQMAGKKCENCRYWSQMVAQSVGNGMEALCLNDNSNDNLKDRGEGVPTLGEYTGEHFVCVYWKLNKYGAWDEPPGYGETSRAKYAADEGKVP